MKLELVVATKNNKKLKEIKEILGDLDLKISSLADYPLVPQIIENGKSFRENALKKAVKVACFSRKLSLGEDSGLEVNALGGSPGIYSSRFSGRDKNDLKNNLKLLKLLANLPLNKRKAHYTCAIALADGDGPIGVVQGRCYGLIGFKPEGHYGFGYDPLFISPGHKKTFARLSPKIKNKISHRCYALKRARVILKKYIERKKTS